MKKFILNYWPVAVVIGVLWAIALAGCHKEFKKTSEFQAQEHVTIDEDTLKAKQQVIAKTLVGDMFSELELDVDAVLATPTAPAKPAWRAKLKTAEKTTAAENSTTNTDEKKSKDTDKTAAVKAAGTDSGTTEIGMGFKMWLALGLVGALVLAVVVFVIRRKVKAASAAAKAALEVVS